MGVVGDDDERRPLLVQAGEDVQDQLLVGLVQVPGGLVRQDDLGVVDECTGDAHALLLAPGELRGQVVGAVGQSHVLQCLERFLLIGHRVVVLGHHDVLHRGEVADEVELLEDQADNVLADVGELGGVEAAQLPAVEPDRALRRGVHAADDVHERGLARARGTDHGEPLAARHLQAEVVQCVQVAVDLGHV